jgi:general L-amino acid transport system substrate-binding protein
VVESVGNYAEIYDRNLGRQSKLRLDRGLNRLWKDGGLMYSPPFR